MKTDKILFGAACFAMGIMLNSVANKSGESFNDLNKRDTALLDSTKMKQPLMKDTVAITNAAKNDSVKILKRICK